MAEKNNKKSNGSLGDCISNSSHKSDLKNFPLHLIDGDNPKEGNGERNEKESQNHPYTRHREVAEDRVESLLLQDVPQTSQEPVETVYLVDKEETNSVKMRRSLDPSKEKLHNATTPDQEFHEEIHKPVRCQGLLRCCHSCCKPCMTEYNPLLPNPTRCDRIKYSLLCPVHGKVARILTVVASFAFLWAVLWSLTGDHALPGGNFFALTVLVVSCLAGGALVEKIRLPPLLGMLIVGCLLRNVPGIDVGKDLDPGWSSALRNIALVVILIRAGLGLDPVALRKLSAGVFRLAFLPCLVEAATAAVASHLLLGFPWAWGFMLGFVLAAVSPAVVVPCMLSLQEKGYGVEKGIPTLVIAAASVDDVLAISGFGVVQGIAFSSGGIALTLVKGPLEALAGVAYGIFFGVVTWYLPHKKYENKTFYRFFLLLCGGLFAVFGSRVADISGAGALGCLTMAFVSAIRWRKECVDGEETPVSGIMASLWVIFQPLLFGLIGAEIDITTIQPQTMGLGIAVLCIGVTLRMAASFFCVFGLGFTMKERLFIPLAWLPKATVQAAIGSVALDTARAKNAPDDQIQLGVQLLTIAVLVILITAPIGAIAITLSAPKLLKCDTNIEVEDETSKINVDQKRESNAGSVSAV